MHGKWKATFQCWPFHGVPQDEAGEREFTETFHAENVEDALSQARVFARGLCRSPKVWQVPIKAIVFEGNGQ